MPFAFRSQQVSRRKLNPRREQQGYILLTLMLAVALVTIAIAAALPEISQRRRDREEELRHRGTEYMRAIQHYYHQFGRYPTSLEELENTNNIRFLRRRYKDPVSLDPRTGHQADFKIVYLQDVLINNPPVPGQAENQGGSATQTGVAAIGKPDDSSSLGTSGVQGNSDSQASTSSNLGTSTTGSTSSPAGSGLNGQVPGRGPIAGVVSTSKGKTIREFNRKNHYNDWYFVYDPAALAQRLLVGPWHPAAIVMGGAPVMAPGQGISSPPARQSQAETGIVPQGSPTQQTPNENPSNN
jgi:type II secretory pathway pseudopilin PulG